MPHVLVAKRGQCALIVTGRWQVVSPSPASYIRLKCLLRRPVRPTKPPPGKTAGRLWETFSEQWLETRPPAFLMY